MTLTKTNDQNKPDLLTTQTQISQISKPDQLEKPEKIGIYDSGIGGVSFLKLIRQMLPQESFIYFGDIANAPYGTKSQGFILNRAKTVTDFLLSKGLKALVIACNTATSGAAKELRQAYPDLIILGMEPAIQLAVNQGFKRIIVLSTPVTSKAENTLSLIEKNKNQADIINLACPGLMELVENNLNLSQEENLGAIKSYITGKLSSYLKNHEQINKTALVLGCTHYIFLAETFKQLYPGLAVLDGNLGTANFLIKVLKKNNLLNNNLLQDNSLNNSQLNTLEIYSSFENLAEKNNFIAKVEMFLEK